MVEGYRHKLHHFPASKSNHSARKCARGVRVLGEGTWDHISVIQPHSPPLPTHIVRGVDVRAGRQQDLCHLRIPNVRRHVKWGALVLRGGRSGKNDTKRKETPLM